MKHVPTRRLTFRVNLPGGQQRLRELVLYVAEKCSDAERFGLIKLNKIIWKADFSAFAARRVPVTGRAYQRLRLGPAPVEMAPLLAEMAQDQLIAFQNTWFGKDDEGNEIVERRPIALVKPNMRLFSEDDLSFVLSSIEYYWKLTGQETSDDSHGMAWRTRFDYEPMPYESAFLSDAELGGEQLDRLTEMAKERRWNSL